MLLDLTHSAAGPARESTVQSTLDGVATHLRTALSASACSVVLYDPTTGEAREIGTAGHDDSYSADFMSTARGGAPVATTEAFTHHRTVVVEDLVGYGLSPSWASLVPHRSAAGWTALVSAPIMDRDTAMGAISVFFTARWRVDADACSLITAMADYAAVAIHNARLLECVRALTALEQRQALARDVHDAVSQNLFSLVLRARAARTMANERSASTAQPPLEETLTSIESSVDAIQDDVRRLITGWHPDVTGSLIERLEGHVDELRSLTVMDLQVVDELPGTPVLSGHDCEELFWVCREAVNNSVKHALASRITVTVTQHLDDDLLCIEVSDDGSGFARSSVTSGSRLGLSSMVERAATLDGTLEVESSTAGSTLRIMVPRGLVVAWR